MCEILATGAGRCHERGNVDKTAAIALWHRFAIKHNNNTIVLRSRLRIDTSALQHVQEILEFTDCSIDFNLLLIAAKISPCIPLASFPMPTTVESRTNNASSAQSLGSQANHASAQCHLNSNAGRRAHARDASLLRTVQPRICVSAICRSEHCADDLSF